MNKTGNTQRNIRSVRENLKIVGGNLWHICSKYICQNLSIQAVRKRKRCLLCFICDLWKLLQSTIASWYSVRTRKIVSKLLMVIKKRSQKTLEPPYQPDSSELDIWEMQIRVHYSVWLSGGRDIDYFFPSYFFSPIGLVFRAGPWRSLACPRGSIWGGEPIHLTTGLSFYLCFNREWAQWNICLKITKH